MGFSRLHFQGNLSRNNGEIEGRFPCMLNIAWIILRFDLGFINCWLTYFFMLVLRFRLNITSPMSDRLACIFYNGYRVSPR